MDFSNLTKLGLPVLEAQYRVTLQLLDSVYSLLRCKKLSGKIELSFITDQDEEIAKRFYFPTADTVPIALNNFLELWANHLVKDRWALECAIEEVKERSVWHNFTKSICNN